MSGRYLNSSGNLPIASALEYARHEIIVLTGESLYTTINGIRTHYIQVGQGSPVVLIHGLGASVATWRDNLVPLAQTHSVYAVDLPGHGDSDKPDIPYDIDSMIRFVRAFVGHLDLEAPALVGHSLGGGLALLTALAHPEMVSHLVLVSSGALGRQVTPFLRLAALPWIGEFITGGRFNTTGLMLRQCFHDQGMVTPELVDELRRTSSLPGAREAGLKVIRNYISPWGVKRKYIRTEELDSLGMPIMIVWGNRDRILPPEHGLNAARASKTASFQVLADCGHWPHMEKSTEFNDLALEFLSS
ncbi:alpha/beta fold hydrolase [Dehalococcoidia bacterium]|nr:alpha/beta fold hydrolase [Dehalococcoidia bacterium]